MDSDPIVSEHDLKHLVRALCAIRTAMPLRVLWIGGFSGSRLRTY